MRQALLALADGSLYWGRAIGADGLAVGEVVFNTAITGYQEILTDPSYAMQIVTLTHPHVGNTGINLEDNESSQIWAKGLVIRDLSQTVSNWRAELSLPAFLEQQGTIGIAEIDTRQLTRRLREQGAQKGCIMAGENLDPEAAVKAAQQFQGLANLDLASVVTTKKNYHWTQGVWHWPEGYKDYSAADLSQHVVVYDFGVKRNILRSLVASGCLVTVVPATTSAEDVMALKPDAVVLSNGPGDPAPCDYAIKAIQILLAEDVPLLGICLGHQLLALACGAQTQKMKFGHHGANHPVVDLKHKKVMISSQNHGFCVAEANFPTCLNVTHRSLFDQTIQGFQHREKVAVGYQGHPEASPGPHDLQVVIASFVELIKESHHAKT